MFSETIAVCRDKEMEQTNTECKQNIIFNFRRKCCKADQNYLESSEIWCGRRMEEIS